MRSNEPDRFKHAPRKIRSFLIQDRLPAKKGMCLPRSFYYKTPLEHLFTTHFTVKPADGSAEQRYSTCSWCGGKKI